MTNKTKKPFHTIRDGSLKATIWRNEGEKGSFYSVELTRTYTDHNGKYHNTTSFSGSDILLISYLASKAYDFVSIAKEADRK